MKRIFLLSIAILLSSQVLPHNLTGTARDSETGDPLAGFDILLTYPSGGIASSATTLSDGTFVLSDVADGTYNMEFYAYDPIILNGDYYLRTIYADTILVNGMDVTGIEFNIPPHHPNYYVSGTLYDATTNEPLLNQNIDLRLQMIYYSQFFYASSEDDGTYLFSGIPDWTYDFTVFENDYYQGEVTQITIDTLGPDTLQMDFYLQPKSGATVSGVLLDSTTNEPIMQAGRSIVIQAINSLFTQTDSLGQFTFVNVPPGIYANIHTSSQDTDYVNCSGSEITSLMVPDSGLSNIQLYQKPWISIHKVTANANTFEPGETKTITFSIVNDNLSYGSIWGLNLIFPDGVSVVNTMPFYSTQNNDVIFDEKPECGTGSIKAWEGWHWVGIPPYASSEGNLDELNEAAWCNVTVTFADSVAMDSLGIFYEVFYQSHCNSIQPFSYGTIMMVNDNFPLGNKEYSNDISGINVYPNPARDKATFNISLGKATTGNLLIRDITGREVLASGQTSFHKGNNTIELATAGLKDGLYFYTFRTENQERTGKIMISGSSVNSR